MSKKLQPWRETALIESTPLSKAAGCRIFLKLENLQLAGSFKIRGIGNYMVQRLAERPITPPYEDDDGLINSPPASSTIPFHFYCSSGGNAGLAAVHAAASLQTPCTVVVPLTTKPYMIAKLRAAGAHDVIQHGESWKEADFYLRTELLARHPQGIYVPPFDHPDIWTGNSSMVPEIKKQMAGEVPDAMICSVGGGGLLCGLAEGLEEVGWDDMRIVAVETKGAESLNASLNRGELVDLDAITSLATSLAVRRVAEKAFEVANRDKVTSVVLSDAEAAMGCWRLADDERMMVELSCGVNVALCYDGRLEKALGRKLTPDTKVVIVLCGGSNVSLDMIRGWKEEYSWVLKTIPPNPDTASEYTT